MNKHSLNKYMDMMRSLTVKKTNGIMAPHKPIMLLSIIDLIRSKKLCSNIIPIDNLIYDSFCRNWKYIIDSNNAFSQFRCSPWTPFWHLKQEPFWHFIPLVDKANIDIIVPKGQTASIGKIRNHIKCAYIDQDLFMLLQNQTSRGEIAILLYETFLTQKTNII